MTTGVLTAQKLKEGILSNTALFETSQTTIDGAFAVASGNHDGAGCSVGPLQYNYGSANRLTELFQYMYNSYKADWDTAFAGYATESSTFYDVNFTYTMAQKVTFGDGISALDANGEKRLIIDPWKIIFTRFGTMQSYRDKYIAMADAYYLPNATSLFNSLSCKSRIAYSSLTDLSFNRGRCFPVNLLTVDFENIDANTMLTDADKEYQKNYQINYRGNYDNAISPLPSPAFAGASPQNAYWHGGGTNGGRRGCMANQSGTYYGTTYDPDVQFDMSQEPAVAFKAELIKVSGKKPKMMFNGVNITKVAKGDAVIFEQPPTYATVPLTKFRTDEGNYVGYESGSLTVQPGSKVWIDVWNWLACKTYYTTDGTTPTTQSQLYTGPISPSASCTLKSLTVSVYGVAEAVKTISISVPVPSAGYRYVKFQGFGDNTSASTTRLVELQAMEGSTNRMAGLTPISGEAVSTGKVISGVTDGILTMTSANSSVWWVASGVPTLVYDLTNGYKIDTIKVYGYSPSTDPRQTKFKVWVSNDNINWVPVIDYSANTTVQPTTGFSFPVS